MKSRDICDVLNVTIPNNLFDVLIARVMPHFTAIALDRLIDPSASKPAEKSIQESMTIPRHPSNPKSGSSPKLERRNSTSSTQRRVPRPQMTPTLYTTPETTPVPYSPSSFPPSPYIINHKSRGPHLVKNPPEANSSSRKITSDEAEGIVTARETSSEIVVLAENGPVATSTFNPVQDNHANGDCRHQSESTNNGKAAKISLVQNENSNDSLVGESDLPMTIQLTPRTEGEGDDFYDPQESMSYTSSTDIEDYGTPDRSSKIALASGEFYDAYEGI